MSGTWTKLRLELWIFAFLIWIYAWLASKIWSHTATSTCATLDNLPSASPFPALSEEDWVRTILNNIVLRALDDTWIMCIYLYIPLVFFNVLREIDSISLCHRLDRSQKSSCECGHKDTAVHREQQAWRTCPACEQWNLRWRKLSCNFYASFIFFHQFCTFYIHV